MIDTETTISRIASLLKTGGDLDRAAVEQVLRDYLAIAQPAAQMLSRCSAWVERGLFAEAVSVADDYPRLLDLGRRLAQDDLSTHVARKLGKFAPAGQLVPVIEASWLSLMERAEGELERCAHRLERHQDTALARGPVGERMRLIRKLIREDPTNGVWGEELRRLEDAAIEDLRLTMKAALERGDADVARHAAGQILQDQWTRGVPEEIRRDAKVALASLNSRQGQARYAELEPQIRDAASRADEPALASLERAWVEVQQTTGVMPSPESDAAVEGPFRWLDQQRRANAQEQAFLEQVDVLEQMLAGRAGEDDVSRQLGQVKTFDRELPPGLEQRVERHLRAIHTARQRKLLLRIAAVVVLAMVSGALVWWRIQRNDAMADAQKIAQQIDAALEHNALDQAQDLFANSGPLSEEAVLVAMSARIRDRLPAWTKDRDDLRLLRGELELALANPVPQKKKDEFQARLKLFDGRLTDAEKKDVESLQAKLLLRASEYIAALETKLAADGGAWMKRTGEVPSLDKLQGSDAYSVDKLKGYIDQVAALMADGTKLTQDFAELSKEQMTRYRLENERLEKASAAFKDRIKAVDDFKKLHAELVGAAADPQKFLAVYERLLGEGALVLKLMGLEQAYRNARETSMASDARVRAWDAMLKAVGDTRFAEMNKLPSAEGLRALHDYAEREKAWEGTMFAKALDGVATAAFKGDRLAGERVATLLESSRIWDLKVIMLKDGGRIFRRCDDSNGVYGTGIIRSTEDVETVVGDLEGISGPKPVLAVDVKPDQAVTSGRIRGLKTALKTVNFAEVRRQLLFAISAIADENESGRKVVEGAAFRLWVVQRLAAYWEQELRMSPQLPADNEIARLVAECNAAYPTLVSFDWAQNFVQPDKVKLMKEMDKQAQEALKPFGTLKDLAKKDRADLIALSNGFTPIQAAGAIGPDPFTGTVMPYSLAKAPLRALNLQTNSWKVCKDVKELEQFVTTQRLGPVLVYKDQEKTAK